MLITNQIRRASATVVALALAAAAAAAPGAGATQEPGPLTVEGPGVMWTGSFENASVPSIDLCDETSCDARTIDVALSAPDTRGRVDLVVAVAYERLDLGYDLDVVVYGPGGGAVATAEDVEVAAAEAVAVRAPADGRYRVVISPRAVAGTLAYRATARLVAVPSAGPVRDLLPNLVARPPSNFHLETGVSVPGSVAFDRGVRSAGSCYLHEAIEQGAARCLRFDQSYSNLGEGPLELRYAWDADERMRQRIFRSDGTHADVLGGDVIFHPHHAHFHADGFAQARLFAANPDGSRGPLVRTGEKNGFCMVDLHIANFESGLLGAQRYAYPAACDPSRTEDGHPVAWLGLSVGWTDTYPWYLADQFIEISGVPDGSYIVELQVNLGGNIVESSLMDNEASTRIRIEGDGVEVVG